MSNPLCYIDGTLRSRSIALKEQLFSNGGATYIPVPKFSPSGRFLTLAVMPIPGVITGSMNEHAYSYNISITYDDGKGIHPEKLLSLAARYQCALYFDYECIPLGLYGTMCFDIDPEGNYTCELKHINPNIVLDLCAKHQFTDDNNEDYTNLFQELDEELSDKDFIPLHKDSTLTKYINYFNSSEDEKAKRALSKI